MTFQNLSFGYTKEKTVLRNINLILQAGKVLGLLGRTGSGKTTLAHLLFRLYDPVQGEIQLAGIPLQQIQLHTLRQHIGMVTQDVQIFHASVRDNLTFFNRSIPDSQILEAMNEVGLNEWYKTQPKGLDTIIEMNGLSAGEAQLLAFVRVLLTNPGLIILDEASARLDPATERRIEKAIEKLLRGRTAIVIAHRLATIQHADTILILDHGQILEYGTRESLQNNPDSHFTHLLQVGLEGVLV